MSKMNSDKKTRRKFLKESAALALTTMAFPAWKNEALAAIAAAYVLTQPFPTFALIGPRLISETVSSLECVGVQLSARELAWLNLERETL